MTNLNAFHSNPFMVLGASPYDDRRRLIALADEAALLSDGDTEAALNQLLHQQRRLDAEIDWFPATQPAQVGKLFDFMAEDSPSAFPEFDTACALAQFNACRALLEKWPIRSTDSAFALCHSLAIVEDSIQAEQLMEDINHDRDRGGFPRLQDPGDVSYRLDNLYRSVSSRLIERFEACKEVEVQPLLVKLSNLYGKLNSSIIKAIVSEYELRNSDCVEKLHAEMLKLASQLSGYATDAQQKACVSDILTRLDKWNEFTMPGRTIRKNIGIVGDKERQLYHDIREAAVLLHNKQHNVEQCLRIIKALQKTFWEDAGAQEQLEKDRQALESVMSQFIQAMRRV